MSPPVDVPAAAFIPATNTTETSLVLVETILCDTVKSPVSVSIRMSPEAVIPDGFTDPMVSTPALTNDKLPSLVVLSPPASVSIEFDEFVSVNVPVPCKPRPDAVSAAVCVTAPVACKLMVLFVAVSAALIARSPPWIVTGPAIVVKPARVISAVLVDLPMVRPPRVEPKFQPDVKNAALKLSATDSMRSAPAPENPLLAVVGALFDSTSVPLEIAVAPV